MWYVVNLKKREAKSEVRLLFYKCHTTYVLFKVELMHSKKHFVWKDGCVADGERRIEREKALFSGKEEWKWSGQMCSNVFWPNLCKDKTMCMHAHICTSQPANISIIYASLRLRAEGRLMSFLFKCVML